MNAPLTQILPSFDDYIAARHALDLRRVSVIWDQWDRASRAGNQEASDLMLQWLAWQPLRAAWRAPGTLNINALDDTDPVHHRSRRVEYETEEGL